MDKQECINELQKFIQEIQNLLDFLQQPRSSPEDKSQAQEMLKTFKNRLGTAYKNRDKVGVYEKMTEIEKAYFFPAVNRAFVNLKITTNSTPGNKWKFELVNAQDILNYYLKEIETI